MNSSKKKKKHQQTKQQQQQSSPKQQKQQQQQKHQHQQQNTVHTVAKKLQKQQQNPQQNQQPKQQQSILHPCSLNLFLRRTESISPLLFKNPKLSDTGCGHNCGGGRLLCADFPASTKCFLTFEAVEWWGIGSGRAPHNRKSGAVHGRATTNFGGDNQEAKEQKSKNQLEQQKKALTQKKKENRRKTKRENTQNPKENQLSDSPLSGLHPSRPLLGPHFSWVWVFRCRGSHSSDPLPFGPTPQGPVFIFRCFSFLVSGSRVLNFSIFWGANFVVTSCVSSSVKDQLVERRRERRSTEGRGGQMVGWGQMVMGRRLGTRTVEGSAIRACFLLPPKVSLCFSSREVFSWNFGWTLERWGRPKSMFGRLWIIVCEPGCPVWWAAGVSHDGKLQRVFWTVSAFKNTTESQREDAKREKKWNFGREKETKERNFSGLAEGRSTVLAMLKN